MNINVWPKAKAQEEKLSLFAITQDSPEKLIALQLKSLFLQLLITALRSFLFLIQFLFFCFSDQIYPSSLKT